MSRHVSKSWRRLAGVTSLLLALAPLTTGPVQASQSGDDHKVTLCHRTNSENKPYVEITVDKAAVFKAGHDTHDEGPVWQPGFKAEGKRWGDIIPPFDYFESPQDERDNQPSHYPGLNWAEGQQLLENGCVPMPPPPQQEEQPFGELAGECVPGETPAFHVAGSFNDAGNSPVAWRLRLSNGDAIDLTESPFDVLVTAPVGTTVTLQFSTGQDWVDADGPVTVAECPPPPQVPIAGGFTVVCDADGAVVTVGELSGPAGVTWVLRVNGVEQPVVSGQVVQVPGEAALVLLSVRSNGTKTARQSATAPEACPAAPEIGSVTKTASPANGSTVAPGSTIAYTVTVRNTGPETLTDKLVVDTLPSFVTVHGTPSDGGVVSVDGRTITWTVTLAPGASKTFTYTGLVVANAPPGTLLVNEVTFLDQRSSTTHTVGARDLRVAKTVTPAGPASVGDILTYTLTVEALGSLPQTSVTVTDDIPAGTSYVLRSAICVGPGDCTVTVADGTVTWALAAMAAGTTRSVQFQVVIDAGTTGDVVNVGTVGSTEVAPRPSNEVTTPVTEVLGVKTGSPPGGVGTGPQSGPATEVARTTTGGGVLAATGADFSGRALLGMAALLLVAGLALLRLAASRSRT